MIWRLLLVGAFLLTVHVGRVANTTGTHSVKYIWGGVWIRVQ